MGYCKSRKTGEHWWERPGTVELTQMEQRVQKLAVGLCAVDVDTAVELAVAATVAVPAAAAVSVAAVHIAWRTGGEPVCVRRYYSESMRCCSTEERKCRKGYCAGRVSMKERKRVQMPLPAQQ